MAESNKMWNPIYTINLSDCSDPDFKLGQVLEINNSGLIFDLRQTSRGCKTKLGIYITVPEFDWFKRCLTTNEDKLFTLEHDSKVITMNKSENQITMTLTWLDLMVFVEKLYLKNMKLEN